ncbi:hypothetical protein ACVBEK_003583 [Cronobacter malonaticus]
MSTISTEQAKDLRNAFECWQQDYDPVEDKEQYEMFGLGVVAMDELLALRKERERAEPKPGRNPVLAYADSYREMAKRGVESIPVWSVITDLERNIAPLYTAPPVPDERYQQLSELYHAQEKRLFKLAQRIKGPSFDKYAHSPSQAIDVLEEAICGENDDACRAAMLAAAPVDVNDDSLPYDPQIAEYEQMMEAELKAAARTAYKVKIELSQMAEELVRDTTALAVTQSAETDTTAQQFESLAGKAVGNDGFECTPVADLYELLTKCGECYDYTTSAKVAAAWIKDGYSAREYVKLDRLQEALLFAAPEPCK